MKVKLNQKQKEQGKVSKQAWMICWVLRSVNFIEGPLGRAHRRPSIYALHTVSDRRREACNLKPAIAWRRNRDGLHCRNSTEMVLICLYVGPPKHVLHELSLLKYRVWRPFFHKMRPDAMQKNRNFTLEPCDKADDAKFSFRKWAINKKYVFFQWILQIPDCNKWCKRGAYRHNWRA